MSPCRTKLPSGWPLRRAATLTNRNSQTPGIGSPLQNTGLALQATFFPVLSTSFLVLSESSPLTLRPQQTSRFVSEANPRHPKQRHKTPRSQSKGHQHSLKVNLGVATSSLPALISKEIKPEESKQGRIVSANVLSRPL